MGEADRLELTDKGTNVNVCACVSVCATLIFACNKHSGAQSRSL